MPMPYTREGHADSTVYPESPMEKSTEAQLIYTVTLSEWNQASGATGASACRRGSKDSMAPLAAGTAPAGQPLTAPAVRPAT